MQSLKPSFVMWVEHKRRSISGTELETVEDKVVAVLQTAIIFLEVPLNKPRPHRN